MKDAPIIHRQLNGYIHILNYTTGEIMSFENDDGIYLLSNLEQIESLGLDEDLVRLFSNAGTQINSRKFRSSLIDLGMEFNFPTIANFELNRRCVLRCCHCYIPIADLKSQESGFVEIFDDTKLDDFIGYLVEMGIFLIVLTGGEPFLNKRLPDVLRKAKAKGIMVEIFSNLQFIPDWFLEYHPQDVNIARIQTSVYSIESSIHDHITGKHGALSSTLKNVKLLKDKGYYIEVATPLMGVNFETRKETAQYFNSEGIALSFAWPIINEYYGGEKGKFSLNIDREQFLQFCKENPDFLIEVSRENPNAPICAAGRALFAISANGDVFPCSQYTQKIGNCLEQSLPEIIKSEEMQRIANYTIQDIPDSCHLHNFCMGNNYSETGHPFMQPSFVAETLKYYAEHS